MEGLSLGKAIFFSILAGAMIAGAALFVFTRMLLNSDLEFIDFYHGESARSDMVLFLVGFIAVWSTITQIADLLFSNSSQERIQRLWNRFYKLHWLPWFIIFGIGVQLSFTLAILPFSTVNSPFQSVQPWKNLTCIFRLSIFCVLWSCISEAISRRFWD
jgi:hypothetical protein